MAVINNILRLLFPERKTAALIRQTTPERMRRALLPEVCGDCIALAPYRDPLIGAAVQEIKFHNNEHAARLLAELVSVWITANVHEPVLVVPMPLHSARARTRGYNQVARVLAHAINGDTRCMLADDLLVRTRGTKPQTTLHKEERAQNVKDAFATRDERAAARIRGAHILLVDDVFTTGATMRAAKAAFLPHAPASVTCIALAH